MRIYATTLKDEDTHSPYQTLNSLMPKVNIIIVKLIVAQIFYHSSGSGCKVRDEHMIMILLG